MENIKPPDKRSSRRFYILLHVLHLCISLGLIVAIIHNQLVNNGRFEKLETKCACAGKSERHFSVNDTKSNDGWYTQTSIRKPITRRNLKKERLENETGSAKTVHPEVWKNVSLHSNETLSFKGSGSKTKLRLDTDLFSCADKLKTFLEDYVKGGKSECTLLKGQKGDHGAMGSRGEKGCAGTSFAPPAIQPVLKSIIIKEKEVAILSCNATANPPSKIFWYRDKSIMSDGNSQRYNITNRDITPIGSSRARSFCSSELHDPVIQSTLVISNTSGADTGVYSCEARNFMGSSILDMHLLVQEYAQCRIVPSNITVVRGGNVLLRCLASGEPNPNITWQRKDGRQMTKGHGDVTRDLNIKSIRTVEEGTFVCKATNVLGSGSCEATVTVNVHPNIESFFGNVVTTNRSENISLLCSASGFPSPEIIWRKVNGSLPLGRAFYDSQKLVISNAQYEDRGKYECSARNLVGMVKKQVLVVVQVPPVITKMENLTEYAYKGKTKVLEFAAFALPKADIVWITPFYVQDSKRFRQENGRLIMESVQFTDSGHYQAVARNVLGKVTSDVFLIVREPVPATIRSIEPNDPTVTVFEGQNVTKTCSAVGVPTPKLSWKYNGTTIKSTVDSNITFGITNASSNRDSGSYSCVARNQFGFEEQHIELQIIEKWIQVTISGSTRRYEYRYKSYDDKFRYRKLNNSTGLLMTYNHPRKYRDNTNIHWTLTSNSRIKLEFLKFSTEKCCDKVNVYDGRSQYSPLLGQFSGYNIPPIITSSSKQLYITFKSDSSKGSSGFLAYYSAII